MKLLLKVIFLYILITSFTSNQESKLDGNYIIKFKNDTVLKNYTHINFKNDSCTYFNNIFKVCKQKVYHGGYLIAFESCDQIFTYDFNKTQIDKDTIQFYVHSKNSLYMDYLHISVNSG